MSSLVNEDLTGDKQPSLAEIFVSSNLLYWKPVSFLITNSIGEMDLSCLGSVVIVAMLFVPAAGSFGISGSFVVIVEVCSWFGGTDDDEDPRML